MRSLWHSSMRVMRVRTVPYCSFQSGIVWAGEGVINPSLSASTLQRALLLTHNYVRFQVVAAMPPNRIVKHTHEAISGSSLGFRPRSHERGSVSKPQSHLLQGHAASRAHACIYNHNSPPRPTGTSSRRTNTIPFVISPPWRGTTVTGGGNLQKTIPAMPITGVWDSTMYGTACLALPWPYPLT